MSKRRRKLVRMTAKPVRAAGRPIAARPPIAAATQPQPQRATPEASPPEAQEHAQPVHHEEAAPQEQPEPQQPEEQPEQEQEEEQEESDDEAPEIHGDVRFPLVSSHACNGRVHTAGVLITPYGCSILHTNATPRRASFGAERVAAAHRGILRILGRREQANKVAEQVILRAREGDQNAMALLSLTRTKALQGNPIARKSFAFMTDYVKRNPVKPGTFGGEECLCISPDMPASVALANGPAITSPRIRQVADSFGHEDRIVLAKGFRTWQENKENDAFALHLDKLRREVLKLGRTLGAAVALQRVRRGGPIALFDTRAAWELGE